MKKIGLIGYGTVGQDVAKSIIQGKAGYSNLTALLVRNAQKIAEPPEGCLILEDAEHFFNLGLDIIVEAGGHACVQQYGKKALQSGSDLIIISVGALSDPDLLESLVETARIHQRQFLIPSGAIAGLDRLAAAAQGDLTEVKLITRKPPHAWLGTIAEEKVSLDQLQEPACIFSGPAREAAKLFPESVNVSAALSLAGLGFERTTVEVYADPTISRNVHEVYIAGDLGEVQLQIQNTPSPANPKTSYIVAMSIVKVLRNLSEPMVIGI